MKKITESYIRLLVSKNLRRIRSSQKISQLSLALDTGLSHNFINDIEKCKKGVSLNTIAKLSTALKVEPNQFFLSEKTPDDVLVYVSDFNDSLQKLVKDLSEPYLSDQKK